MEFCCEIKAHNRTVVSTNLNQMTKVVFGIDLGGSYAQYNGNKFKAKIGKTTQNSNYFPRSVNVHFGDNDMGK